MSRARTGYSSVLLALVLSIGCALAIEELTSQPRVAFAVIGGALAVAFAWFGRRDLSAPYVILPVIWFTAVSVSQIKLINYETDWSAETALVAFGAPLVFAASSWAVGRGSVRPANRARIDMDTGKLHAFSLAFLLLGIAGTVLKAGLLGGIPILSDSIDTARSAGGIKIPFYVTFLTDCILFSGWFAGMRYFILRSRGIRPVSSLLIMAIALAGAAFGASRNQLLIAIGIPLIFAYILGVFRSPTRRQVFAGIAVFALVIAISSGLFFLRTGQHKKSSFEAYFYNGVVRTTPPVLRPTLPFYIGLATPFETLNRVVKSTDAGREHRGYYSFPGLPQRVTPWRKANFYDYSAALSRPYYFNVATFAGPLYADGGMALALGAALLLGILFGSLRLMLLRRPTVASIAVAAYLTYVTGFLFYENLAAFYTLSIAWDVGILWIALSACAPKDRPSLVS